MSLTLGRIISFSVFIASVSPLFGQGGPPLLTDDPGTPGNRNWEINIASMLVLAHGDRDVQAPLLDLNYGLGDRIQLKYQTPYIWDSEGGAGYRATWGIGYSA